MRLSQVLMWALSTMLLLVYLMAIEMVRGEAIMSHYPSNGFLARSSGIHVPHTSVDFNYHNHQAVEAIMRGFAADYPHLAQMYSVGKSVQGRDLWVLLITKNPSEEPLLKPNVKYVANMHGNEVSLATILTVTSFMNSLKF